MIETKTYTSFDGKNLDFKVFSQSTPPPKKLYPTIIMFFGGGWMTGTIEQFRPQAEELAKKGFVVFTPYYRVYENDGTTIDVALKDAEAFLKFIKLHAGDYFLDLQNVYFCGASAGGHIALSQVLFEEYNSGILPKGLVLYNPVIDTSKDGYQSVALTLVDTKGDTFSPVLRLKKLPKTLIFHGTADKTMNFKLVEKFVEKARLYESDINLVPFEDRGHGFFNLRKGNRPSDYSNTLDAMIKFCKNLSK